MSVQIESVPLRSASSADWASQGTILGVGELGLDTTTGQLKAGNGTDTFAALPAGSAGGAKATGRATLVAGTVTVANANALTASNIFLTVQSLGTVTAPKAVAVTARSNGVSFTITSSDNTDTSVVAWQIW